MIIFDNLFKQLQQSNTQQARGMPPILASEICATIDKPSLTELSTQVFRDNSGGVRTLATGSTVMHMLAFFRRGDVIALLLKDDPTPLAAKNEEGLTPFAIAAQANNLITMRKLTQITLFQGTETQKQLHDFDRALQEALRADHLNVVRYLVEEMECQLPLVATWDRDETLLISLFQRGGRYALAAFVLAKQQDARQVSRYSGQPLLTMAVTRALAEGRARAPELDDFIRVLLQSGAGIDVNIEDADLSRRGGIVASKIAQYLNAIIETWPEFSALHLPDFLMLCGLTIGKIPFSQMPTKNTDIPLIFDDRSLRANRAAVMQCYDHYHAIFAGLAAAGEMSEETQAVLRGMQLLQLLSPGGLQARALAVCREL